MLTKSSGEHRIGLIYLPAVIVYSLIANIGLPVVEVIWDMVFYKNLSYELYFASTFALADALHPMPPLYPLLLAPAWSAGDYLTVEIIQSLINPALYFLGLFPLYRLCRALAGPDKALLGCVLYVFYPAVIYTQWMMSENLAAPLAITAFWLAFLILSNEKNCWKASLGFGVVMAALCLTRMQSFALGGAILAWLAWRCWRQKRSLWPLFAALIVWLTIVFGVWASMGYIGAGESSPFYFDLEAPEGSSPLDALINWAKIALAQAAGLWIEGGLWLVPLSLGASLIAVAAPSKLEPGEREYAKLVGMTFAIMCAAAALYYVLRSPYEDWSISTRYLFYVNQASIPLAVLWLGRRPGGALGWCAAIVVAAALCGTLFGDGVWQALGGSHTFFTNAPSLDFMTQLKRQTPAVGAAILGGAAFIAISAWILSIRAGALVACGLLTFVQLAALDHAMEMRSESARLLWGRGIHAFCDELEAGRWSDAPIYCDEAFPYISPSIHYFTQRGMFAWPEDGLEPPAPYLLVTANPRDGLAPVFDEHGLRAYWIEPRSAP